MSSETYTWQTIQQYFQWNSPSSVRPKKATQVRLDLRSMLADFLDSWGWFSWIVSSGQTVNYCWEDLQHQWEQVCSKHPRELWNHNWSVHHDIVLVHTVVSVQHFLPTKIIAVVSHPPCLRSLDPLWHLLVFENEVTAVRLLFTGCPWNLRPYYVQLQMLYPLRTRWGTYFRCSQGGRSS